MKGVCFMQKLIFNNIVAGAGACIGWVITSKAIAAMSDPYQRAKLKQKIKNVKSALLKND